ncbi:hypothetical protein [Microbacterium sp. E-13]|uniref:hypothetical protein n=1 Tax=Microbacterium sp. E-13 TaxID=3404048 RepID=UPI003CFAFDE0
MANDMLKDEEFDALIGVLAAVDTLLLAGLLDDHAVEVLAHRLRVTARQNPGESGVQYVHGRLDNLNQRLRDLNGEREATPDGSSGDSPQ